MFQFRNIRSRLTFWFFILSILPMVAANTIVYEHMKQSRKDNILSKLEAVRDLKVEELNKWLDERTGDVHTIVADPHILALEGIQQDKADNRDKNNAIITSARDHLSKYLKNYKYFYEIQIIDPHDRKILICTNKAHEGEIRKGDIDYDNIFQGGGSYIRDIYYSDLERRPTMAFYMPVYSQTKSGHIFGILAARINLDTSLYPLLLHRTGMGETGETLIVNRDGVALSELRWHENAPLNLKIRAIPAVEASRGNTGIKETEDYRGEMVLAAYTYIPKTGWGFVAKQDLKEIYHTIYELRNWVISIGIVAICIVIVAAFRVSKSVSEPIKALQKGSEIIGGGNLDHKVGTDVQDEIGQLSRSFDKMTFDLKTSRTALEESEDKYRRFFTTVPTGWAYHKIEVDENNRPADYIFLEVNDAFERLTGLKREDIIGKRVTEVIPGTEKDPADWIGKYGEVALTGREIRFDNYSEGIKKWFLVSASSPERGYFITVFEDITESKTMEKQLQEGARLRQLFMDSLPCVALLLKRDTREIVASNRTAIAIGAVPGKTCYKTFGKSEHPCPWCLAPKVWTSGEAQHEQFWGLGIYWDAYWIPASDELYLHYAFDITDRKRAEEKLQEEKEKLKKYLDISAVIVVMIDADQKVTLINRKGCELLGYSEEEIIGKNWFDHFLPERIRDNIKQVHTRLLAGEIEPLEYYENEVLTSEGEERTIAWYNTVFRDKRGRITQTLGSGADITERKKTDELIRKSLREKEVLVKEIHHRVKNNMAVISSLLKLQANKIDDKKYRDMFNDSMGRIKSMALLHEKLYRSEDLSRLDFSAYLKEVVMAVFTSYRMVPGRISLKMDIEDVDLGIDAAIPCGLIVNELVSNSLKHAFPGDSSGRLTVSLHMNDEAGVELRVSDNGVGMSGNIDFRNTASLGLNLVNTLVRQLQGKMEVDGEQGTEFKITFQEA